MKALIVIDIQNGLTKRKTLFNEISFFDTVNEAIKKYHDKGYRVIYVQHNNRQLSRGTEDWEIDNRIIRNQDDRIIQKAHGNAFKNTDLESYLEENQINDILIAGLVSHGCVRATSIGGQERGFNTRLLKDGHTNWNKDAESKIRATEVELQKSGIQIIDKYKI